MADRQVSSVVRRQTFTILAASDLGDDVSAIEVEADVRKLPGGRNSYMPSSTVAATYGVEDFAGDATYGPGWYLTLTTAQTESLSPGTYVSDVRVTDVSGDITYSAQWLLEVLEAITQ